MGYKNLAYAIVLQAVEDYYKCKKRGKPVAHLVKFFKSDWCNFLLIDLSLTGEDIAKQLRSKKYSEFSEAWRKVW